MARGKLCFTGKKILRSFDDVDIVITGSVKDKDISEGIVKRVQSSRCCSIAGETDLNELAGVFQRSELVISADSGPLHLASSTGTTTIGLFGPTSSDITGPRGAGNNIVLFKPIECVVPCYVDKCVLEYACMKAIRPDEVFGEAKKILSDNNEK